MNYDYFDVTEDGTHHSSNELDWWQMESHYIQHLTTSFVQDVSTTAQS